MYCRSTYIIIKVEFYLYLIFAHQRMVISIDEFIGYEPTNITAHPPPSRTGECQYFFLLVYWCIRFTVSYNAS